MRPNGSGKDLLLHIELLNSKDLEENQIRTRVEELRQQRNLGIHTPLTTYLLKYLTPYAVRLVLEQEKLSNMYRADDVAQPSHVEPGEDFDIDPVFASLNLSDIEGDRVRKVTRMEAAADLDEMLQYDEHGKPLTLDSGADFGLKSCDIVGEGRYTTFVDCSCQFPRSFDNLPCRHIIANCRQAQIETYPIDNIGARWLKTKDEIKQQRVKTLLNTPASAASSFAPAMGTGKINVSERRTLLLREFDSVVDVACKADDQTFERVLDALSTAFKTITRITDDTYVSRPTRSAEPVAAVPVAAPTAANTPAQPASADKLTLHADEKQLAELLDITEKLAQVPPMGTVDTSYLQTNVLGKRIAIKLLNKNQKGWFLGTVTKAIDANIDSLGDMTLQCSSSDRHKCNVQIKFDEYDADDPNDPELQGAYFCESNMVSSGNASIYSWGLIETQELSNAANIVRNPLGGRKTPGRAEHKRKKPVCGPTSGNPKRPKN